MDLSHTDGVCLEGFSDPITIEELRRTRYFGVPKTPGVDLVMQTSNSAPRFLANSTGGWFKRKDPSYHTSVVHENWVDGARVIYVGMTRARKGLRGRLCQFFDFGAGKPVGHRGGRLLWHLENSGQLLVRWKMCGANEADTAETAAIAGFKAVYGGKRPFANMNK